MAKHYNIWWGPPKKFSTEFEERKISWLELFYDLVYVIVISKITHRLAHHQEWIDIVDYAYLFAMTFWGWYNGSQYHDLHGSPGIRTRFMTLWQMVAVGALAVTLDSPAENMVQYTTISILVLQLFITYLWWSVGIYDKEHRQLNMPYSVCYIAAFLLLMITLYIPQPHKRIVFWIALVLNYAPSFFTAFRLKEKRAEFTLSSSMTERLGLLTIIVFGEAILGVINGIGQLSDLNMHTWISFGLGILIVFALWWIFFSLIADRNSKKGMLAGSTMSLVYIPTLASLGMVGAAFPALLKTAGQQADYNIHALQIIYGVSIALFLSSIVIISRFLIYPKEYERPKRLLQPLLIAVGMLNILLVLFFPALSVIPYLLCVFISLLFIIIVITRSWFRVELSHLA
ncbi:MAG: low temperature requirement protein A [Bacteroidetes bacterium]|nr:low temperature requirement protein A [Bacteroidota bacterium]